MARFLVRHRVAFFVTVVALVAVCATLIPLTNINTDMTKYLPDDYQMRQGMDILEQDLPAMHEQLRTFGTIFADGNDLIPNDLPKALIVGFSLACVVLFIMCSSFMEVILFLVTIGFAVVLNMGTNALLPSVSMMTHMLANILQMVLSMDYCIILMNRYKLEKGFGLAPVNAMENAVSNASASILSSAFTTIVSLSMLIFMKIKIGADMGVVLAKGVSISLFCNFTVLPCLILWFDKAIDKTRRKKSNLSPAGLARFESKFKVPLAILFLAAFVLFAIIQKRTPMSFSPNWTSAATEGGPEKNDLLLLYPDGEEQRIPALLDSLKTDPMVTTTISYPSLVQRPLTADEMGAFFREMAGDEVSIPAELLPLVYYAQSHPERTEKFTLEELMECIDELRAKGFVDRKIDVESLFSAPAVEEPVISGEAEEAVVETPGENEGIELIGNVEVVPPDFVEPENTDNQQDPQTPYTRFTYEQATTPVTAAELAAATGVDKSMISMVYRMAGKARGTMLPLEFITFVQEQVLTNRRYAAMAPKGAAEQLEQIRRELEIAIAKGPGEIPEEVGSDEETVISEEEEATEPQPEEETVEEIPEVVVNDVVEEMPMSPVERLAEMMFNHHRYSSTRVYRALKRAGIKVSQEELDLLYLYCGAKRDYDPGMRLSPGQLLDFVADTLIHDSAVAPMLPDSLGAAVLQARDSLLSSAQVLLGNGWSAAVVMSEYEVEGDESFAYIERTHARADEMLEAPHYWIGASEMYKELKDGFPAEVTLLTLLTVLSIFLIVAFTFRSVLIPIPLVLTVLTGIYAEVWAVGAGGQTMYFISYLIVQGILMGATIDYSILFTSCYLRYRKTQDVNGALAGAYDTSLRSILSSGLILVLVPFAMSFTMGDAMICSILKSISAGAATILLLILLVLPGVIAALDRIVVPRRANKRRSDAQS